MLSATGITAALAILAISVNVIDSDPVTPGQVSATHVVAANGSGDFDTIQAAVDAAADGDTIAVLAGTYTEAIVIDKDLILFGEGPREEIVLTAPEGGPEHDIDFAWLSQAPYAMLLVEADATVRDLTLAGEPSRLFVEGGAPTVSGVLFDQVGQAYEGSGATVGAVVVQGMGTPTFTENELVGGGGLDAYADADPVFEGNTLHESGSIAGDFGPAAVIRDNTITGAGRQGITFLGATAATVVGNTIEGKEWGITTGEGINVTTSADGSTFEPTIEGNSISDTKQFAIHLSGGSPILLDNTLAGGRIGISLIRSSATVSRTDVGGFAAGVVINLGDATLMDNTITDNGRGLALVGGTTQLTLSGNTICDNETNLHVADDQDIDTEGNEICEDVAPAE
jgi:parallel beta-helix repeat protein